MKKMKLYTIEAIENFMREHEALEICEFAEPCLGLGSFFCNFQKFDRWMLVKEVYLNEWSSGHTVRFYKEIPEKYRKLYDKHLEETA